MSAFSSPLAFARTRYQQAGGLVPACLSKPTFSARGQRVLGPRRSNKTPNKRAYSKITSKSISQSIMVSVSAKGLGETFAGIAFKKLPKHRSRFLDYLFDSIKYYNKL